MRRQPLALRDRSDLSGAVRSLHRGQQSAEGPGGYGRMASAQPTGTSGWDEALSADDADGDYDPAPAWEANDRHLVTAADVTRGYSVIELSQTPIEESLVLWWRTVAQEPNAYDVDAEAQTVTVPLDEWVAAGDHLWVHYAYRAGLDPLIPDPEQVAFHLVGAREVESNYPATVSSLALPTGTQLGDLIVYAQIGGFGTGATYADPTDGRLTPVGVTSVSGRPCGVYIGYADSLGALAVSFGGGNNAFGQFVLGMVATYRADDADQVLTYDEHRFAVSAETAGGHVGTIPEVPFDGSGAIAVVFGSSGIGGAYADFDWSLSAPYALSAQNDNSYVVASYGVTAADPVPSAVNPEEDPADQTVSIVVGLDYA